MRANQRAADERSFYENIQIYEWSCTSVRPIILLFIYHWWLWKVHLQCCCLGYSYVIIRSMWFVFQWFSMKRTREIMSQPNDFASWSVKFQVLSISGSAPVLFWAGAPGARKVHRIRAMDPIIFRQAISMHRIWGACLIGDIDEWRGDMNTINENTRKSCGLGIRRGFSLTGRSIYSWLSSLESSRLICEIHVSVTTFNGKLDFPILYRIP